MKIYKILHTNIMMHTVPCSSPLVNTLPDMPILGSSNLAANKDTMSKLRTRRDTII